MSNMSKLPIPKFERINRPMVRDGGGAVVEGIFEDSDPVFCPIKLTDEEPDKMVRKIVEYRGFICKQREPNFHWVITAAVDGSELPLSLQGHFTNAMVLRRAINEHLAKPVQA